MSKKSINSFTGVFEFLSNEYPTWIMYETIQFPNIDMAFQAARVKNHAIRKAISNAQTYQQFISLVQGIDDPPDWKENRFKIMEELVRQKFIKSRELRQKLIFETKGMPIVNTYEIGEASQKYWGLVNGSGLNQLGNILEMVRQDSRSGKDLQKWAALAFKLQANPKLRPKLYLKVIKDQKVIQIFQCNKLCTLPIITIGSNREKNDITLFHPSISRRHAAILFEHTGIVKVMDLASKENTRLSGQVIPPFAPIELMTDQILEFGNSTRKYVVQVDGRAVSHELKQQQREQSRNLKRINEALSKRRSRSRERD